MTHENSIVHWQIFSVTFFLFLFIFLLCCRCWRTCNWMMLKRKYPVHTAHEMKLKTLGIVWFARKNILTWKCQKIKKKKIPVEWERNSISMMSKKRCRRNKKRAFETFTIKKNLHCMSECNRFESICLISIYKHKWSNRVWWNANMNANERNHPPLFTRSENLFLVFPTLLFGRLHFRRRRVSTYSYANQILRERKNYEKKESRDITTNEW